MRFEFPAKPIHLLNLLGLMTAIASWGISSTMAQAAIPAENSPDEGKVEALASLLAESAPNLSIVPEALSQTIVAQAPTPQIPFPVQEPDSFPIQPAIPRDPIPVEPLPQQPAPPLPPPSELLRPGEPSPTPTPQPPGEVPATIRVERYVVEGSTVFSEAELQQVTRPFVGEVSFAQLLQARSAVTDLYVRNGYITSGAFIPPQTLEGGVVKIQVLEGRLEDINVTGTGRLNPNYVRSRIALAARPPLNVNRLLEGLQLLQLNPLIQSLSADLEAGTRPGTSLLQVRVTPADTFSGDLTLDNGRSPSVGSFRRQAGITEANLFGQGDAVSLTYSNTDGSNAIDASYTYPINPRNGTLRIAYGATRSNVIEEPFNILDLTSRSSYLELSLRQPIYQTPTQEFALGLTASRQSSRTLFNPADTGEIAFPTPGADADGRVRISALRFFQEWVKRDTQQVLAARSQFSLGLDALDATINSSGPDSRFFSWRGQGQWVRLLAPDTLLLLRGDLQLTGDPLLAQEQFSLGGQETIRGYRQDFLLADNGALLSAEVRIPVLRVPRWQGVLQVVPFIDVGTGWNSGRDNPETSTVAGLGLGLLWRQGDRFSARIDWGIPLVDVNSSGNSLQENGIYFSINFSPF